jgi:chromosome segregation ATPase
VPARPDTDDAALAGATSRLYAAAPEEFVATRTLLVQDAKAAGQAAVAREVGRLRKPTVAAWAVNHTVRQHREQVARLEDVGRRLRAAQARLDAAQLKDLRSEREALLADFLAAAQDSAHGAGRPLAPAVLDEVRATLIAALASEEATEAVVSGHLTRALAYSGFGEVDLSEAVVRTSSGAVLTVLDTQGGRRSRPQPEEEAAAATEELTAATEELTAATEELAAATEELAVATAEVERAGRLAEDARTRVMELQQELGRAHTEQEAAEEAVTAARRARKAAEAARHTAQRRLEQARQPT